MINATDLKMIANNCVKNADDFYDSFRRNVMMYVSEPNLSVKELSELADIPLESFKNFLYKDMPLKLSYAVNLAKVLNISVDELLGCETMTQNQDKVVKCLRCLPKSIATYFDWLSGYLFRRYSNLKPKHKAVAVMMPSCDPDGRLRSSNVTELVDISHLEEFTREKIRFGLRVFSDFYLPHYLPNDIIYVANDRPSTFHEHILVSTSNRFLILRKENGIYYSIRDDKPIDNDIIEEVLGYICFVEHEK